MINNMHVLSSKRSPRCQIRADWTREQTRNKAVSRSELNTYNKIFKAYDVRGIYPSEINEKIAYKIGRAFVTYLNASKVVVGRDIRLSGDKMFKALADGITDQGADVIDIGQCSTDMLYFGVAKYGYPAGIMVTASHNPKEYNGMKFTREKAIPVGEDSGLLDVKRLVDEGKFKEAKKGKTIKKDVLDDFINHLTSLVKKIKPMKVMIDGGNGTAGLIVPKLFEKLNLGIIPICLEPDGNFPDHQPNPLLEENRKEITKRMSRHEADIGLAFDGDCDRCFFIDDNGEFVPGDFILALLAEHQLKTKKGKVLYDVRSSWAVKDTVTANGGIPIEYRVGHAFMKKKMRDENALFGGEVSGHYYFKDFFNCDSGFVVALKVLDLISAQGKLSGLTKKFSKYYVSGEINSTVEYKDEMITELEEIYKDGKIHHIDGISVEYPNWHFNVRKSNTEPLLRLNLEATSKKLMEEKVNEVLGVIRE